MEFQALDFSDLIYQTVVLLSEHSPTLSTVWQTYQYLLVDEYQDTNEIQYALTKLISSKYRQLTVVGDASQSIYGWRGANFRNLMNITTDFPDTKIINLELNYRSTQTILTAANTVISKNTSHPVLDLKATRTTNNPIQVAILDSEIAEAEFVAAQIKLYNGQIPFQQIAVLYRTNAQSRVIEEVFLKHLIPYVLIGGLRFYDRSEIKDILAMLRYIFNPKDQLSWGRIQKAIGKRASTVFLSQLMDFDPQKQSTLKVLETVLTNTGYLNKYDPRDEDDQRRLENIKELQSVATSFPKLPDFLENVSLVQQEYSLQEKNKKNENRTGVRLMTLHSSKGLEFESVFIVGFEEGILPHSRSLIEDVDIEEERRLCYVGITRAKDYLYLTHTRRRLFFGKSSLNQPSRFLSDIPSSLVETTDYTSFTAGFSPKSPHSDSDFLYDPDIY
jgi:DNA helicase-2/ATP-dependent DNA helicase PcrA